MTSAEEPSDPPIKAASRAIEALKVHELKQLFVADKPRIPHLEQERNIACRIDHQTVFCVPHNERFKRMLLSRLAQACGLILLR